MLYLLFGVVDVVHGLLAPLATKPTKISWAFDQGQCRRLRLFLDATVKTVNGRLTSSI